MRTYIKDIKKLDGKDCTVCGFVHEIRDLKKMQFIVLRDVTGDLQVTIFKTEQNAALNELVAKLPVQSSIRVTGLVKVDSFVKMGGVELHASDVKVVNAAASPLPIDMSGVTESGKEARAEWRFLDLRDKKRLLAFKVQTTMLNAMRQYWYNESFVEIQSPKFVPTPSEGGAELFELDYFGQTVYLAQSPQTYKQMAIAAGFDKVFEIGPVFRADKSHTNRHLTEFISVDVEMAWIDGVEDILKHMEGWISYFMNAIKDKHGDEIKEVFGIDVTVPITPFKRLTMTEAKQIVQSLGYTVPPETKGDLDPAAERMIGKYVKDKFGQEFVFITEYPTTIRPFYHMYFDENRTKSFDLLFNGLEITTGAQREHDYITVIKQAIKKGVIPTDALKADGTVDDSKLPVGMDAYFNCFKYGCPPHGGFGFGLSRMLMQLLHLDNVKEATFISRTVDKITP